MGEKGKGKNSRHSGQHATSCHHPNAHCPIQSYRLEERKQRVHPALFCNSFREESNNLEVPEKNTENTLKKNLVPTSPLSSGLLYYCHFLSLIPLLPSLDIFSPLQYPMYDPLPLRFHDVLRRILTFIFFRKKASKAPGYHCTAKWSIYSWRQAVWQV